MSDSTKIVPLANLCDEFTDGNWVQSKDQSPSGIRLVQTGNIGTGTFKNRLSKARFISEDTFRELKCTEVFPGDCLVSRLPDPVGRACIVPDLGARMITAVDCSILRLDSNRIIPNYFIYYTQAASYFNEVERYCTGATRKRISRKNLGKVGVPVPALSQQKRIVAILDEAFAGIETAITNTEKNIANAREVIDARLAVLFANRHQNWICGPLNDFVELVSTGPFGSLLHKSDYVSDGIPLINPVNIQGDSIVPDPNKRVDKEGFKKLRAYVLRAGDIVIARRGEIGRCAVISQEQDGWVCGTGCFFIRPSKKTDPCFLAHLLRSRPYREKLEQSATGATMLNLSNKVLAGLPVSMPAIDEQKKIADYISGFETDCLKISAVQKRKIYLLGELKQSLLQKAFSGELTTDRAERELAVVMP